MLSVADSIGGKVKAGTFIGGVKAGKNIAGGVEATGGNIGEVVAGTLGGGDISGAIKAGGNVGQVPRSARGPSPRNRMYSSTYLPVGIEWLPGGAKPTQNVRPKPNSIPLQGGTGGNISGTISANNIGSVTAFGNVSQNVTAQGTLARSAPKTR